MSSPIRILFIGDIVADPGIKLMDTYLSSLLQKHNPHFVILNGENAHEGMGLNRHIVKNFYDLGVHAITGGNHSFAKWKIYPYMKEDKHLLRPFNYPRGAHGYGFGIYEIPDTDYKIGVLNLMGRTYMQPLDDPFKAADYVIDIMKEETNIIFLDFHAEATAEKMAMGWHVDGRVSVNVGTHTHIPTNDARILPEGTGYITDVGMTGSYNSVIGMDKETALKRFLLQTPHRYKSADGDNRICGILADVNPDSGKCVHIESIVFPEFNRTATSD